MINNSSGAQVQPAVAYGTDNYLVIWSDNRDTSAYRIYACRVTRSGAVLDGSGILIGPNSNAIQYAPSLVHAGSRFFAIWGYYSTPYAVTGRFIDAGGTPSGDTVRIATAGGTVMDTRLAYSGSGFLAIWIELASSIGMLRGRCLSPEGTPSGGIINIADDVYEYNSLSLNWDGRYYLVTYSKESAGLQRIYGRLYNGSGQSVAGPFLINNSSYSCYYCDAASDLDSHYLNVWSEYHSTTTDIYGNVDLVVGVEQAHDPVLTEVVNVKSSVVRRFVEINNPGKTGMKLYDIKGRLVGSTSGACFDCGELPTGIYFVETGSGDQFKILMVR